MNLRPGDLVFYNNFGHVAVYIGNGQVVTNGKDPGPTVESVNYWTTCGFATYPNVLP